MAGRRPGSPDTRGDIIRAARAELAHHGYDGTSIRAVARRAGVDPALVHHYFKDKPRMVEAALALPIDPLAAMAPVLQAPEDDVGTALVQAVVSTWDDPANREAIVATARTSLTGEDRSALIQDFVLRGPVDVVLAARCPDATAITRAMVMALLLGVLTARYLAVIDPMPTLAVEEVAALVGPSIQRYLSV